MPAAKHLEISSFTHLTQAIRNCSHLGDYLIVLCKVGAAVGTTVYIVAAQVDLEHFPLQQEMTHTKSCELTYNNINMAEQKIQALTIFAELLVEQKVEASLNLMRKSRLMPEEENRRCADEAQNSLW
jgi:hypothetical protein